MCQKFGVLYIAVADTDLNFEAYGVSLAFNADK